MSASFPRLTTSSRVVLAALAIVPLCATASWILTDTGLYRILIEWQLVRWGVCYEGYTGVFVFVATLGAFAFLARLALDRGWLAGIPADGKPRAFDSTEGTAVWRAFTHWLRENSWSVTGISVGVFLIVVGAFEGIEALTAGPRTPVLITGGAPRELPSRWLILRGKPLPQRAVSLGEARVGVKDHYVPMGESGGDEPGEVAFLLHVCAQDLAAELEDRETFEGLVRKASLPLPVREALMVSGVTLTASPTIVDWKVTPGEKKQSAALFLFLGSSFVAVAAAATWIARRKRDRHL